MQKYEKILECTDALERADNSVKMNQESVERFENLHFHKARFVFSETKELATNL